MSLTSYRAAPPRGGEGDVNGFLVACSRASMPGDDLLFHRLSDSTIGAVGFHGRVRDGIGWDTDAMATRQWSLRACVVLGIIDACTVVRVSIWLGALHPRHHRPRADGGGVELSSATRAIRTG